MAISLVGFKPSGMAMFLVWVALTANIAVPSGAATIFDDDWTPPPAAKKPPAHPPGPAASDTQTKPPALPTPPPPAISATPSLRPIPAQADQAKSRKVFREVFANELADRSPAARRSFAAKLLEQAASISDAVSDEYVLLVAATQAAKEASDLKLAFRAIDMLAAAYEIDGMRFKSDVALGMSLRAGSPEQTSDNCRAGLELVDQLAAEDDYATASRLLQNLRSATVEPALVAQIQRCTKEVDAFRVAAEHIAVYRQKLKTSPDDPAANFAVGKYLCVTKNDWAQGVTLLAKGSNADWSAAAALDVAAATDPMRQPDAGDAWWAVAEKETGANQLAVRQHAAAWYSAAVDAGVVSGLKRAVAEKRVATVGPLKQGKSPSKVTVVKAQSVLWFRGNSKEEPPLQAISDGRVKEISKSQVADVLADPNAYANVTIVVWGVNRWRETAPELLTDDVVDRLQRFVRDGGDLIMFEQFAMTNMKLIDRTFNIHTGGGQQGARIVPPALRAKAASAGYTDDDLDAIHFYNSYDKLPTSATILVQEKSGHNAVVMVPFGRGRLILFGTNLDPAQVKLVYEILDFVYRFKSSNASTGPRAAGDGSGIFLSELTETKAEGIVQNQTWEVSKDVINKSGQLLAINGVRYARGVCYNPDLKGGTSRILYTLGGRYRRFTGLVGVDDSGGGLNSVLTFRIVGDGRELWKSKPYTEKKTTQTFAADVARVNKLELVVECQGRAQGVHVVWLDPRLELK
jgi:hypothetical protein